MVKMVLSAIVLVAVTISLVLGILTWRRIGALETELVHRHVLPVSYITKPVKKIKTREKKSMAAHRDVKSRRSGSYVRRTPAERCVELQRGAKSQRGSKRSLDDVINDMADKLIVVDD